MVAEERQALFEALLNRVMLHIEGDIALGDYTAIDELLSFIPVRSLIAYLPEEEWYEYKALLPAGEEV